jgi:hypothetical protein
VRDRGDLVQLDTYDQLVEFVSCHSTCFISHQWLGVSEPDPQNRHFPAMVQAVKLICEQFDLEHDELYVWVDYFSIPQRNLHLKELSIGSLGEYATAVRFFVVCAPEASNFDSGTLCDAKSYQLRGWCRLEQWARMTVGGLRHMFLLEGSDLVPIIDQPHWYSNSICVFDGEFTNDADKPKLVDSVLGLYGLALLGSRHDEDTAHIIELVATDKARIFPPHLFGDLPEVMERTVAAMKLRAPRKSLRKDVVSAELSTITPASKRHRTFRTSNRQGSEISVTSVTSRGRSFSSRRNSVSSTSTVLDLQLHQSGLVAAHKASQRLGASEGKKPRKRAMSTSSTLSATADGGDQPLLIEAAGHEGMPTEAQRRYTGRGAAIMPINPGAKPRPQSADQTTRAKVDDLTLDDHEQEQEADDGSHRGELVPRSTSKSVLTLGEIKSWPPAVRLPSRAAPDDAVVDTAN